MPSGTTIMLLSASGSWPIIWALGDLGVYGVVDLEVEELFKLGAVHDVLIAVADEVGYVYPLRDAEDVAQPVVPEENKDRN